jgi:methylenetetrahydrofolate dehydrogenase (NADP+) / methenyltetrahydrofolate cyclohydrolase
VERRTAGLTAGGAAVPTLAMVQTDDDPAAGYYLRSIERAFERHGLATVRRQLDHPDQAALAALLDELSAESGFTGILLTQPLPAPLRLDLAVRHLHPEKDVEGAHPIHVGALAQGQWGIVPSTPLAGMEILKAAGTRLRGASTVIVGRSQILGRPLIQLLLAQDATVTVCHSRTADLGAVTRQADVLLVATGRAGLIDGSMVKPGATVIDFGINEVDGKLVGDADFASVSEVAGDITPVPGGVGPVTTAVLARNLVELAERARGPGAVD